MKRMVLLRLVEIEGKFFFIVLRGELYDFFDDIAGVFIARKLYEMRQKDVLNERFVFFGMGDNVLHDVISILTLS